MDVKRLENLLKFKLGAVDPTVVARIPDFIADAIAEANNWDWKFAEENVTFVLVLGQEEYPLPDNWRKFKSAPRVEGASATLGYADSSVIDAIYPKHADTGEPLYYNVLGDKVLFYPVANATWAGKKAYATQWKNVVAADLPEIFGPVLRNKILSEQLPSKNPEQKMSLLRYQAQWPTILQNHKSTQEEEKTLLIDEYTESFNNIRNDLRVRPR